MSNLSDQILDALRDEESAAGISIRARYQPSGGSDGKVFPPTYPGEGNDKSGYLRGERLLDGAVHDIVVLDQTPSQANRVEEALLAAVDRGRLKYPLFEMRVETDRGQVRLTSLDLPHRYADAYLRDSEIDGVRFDRSSIGLRIRQSTVEDVTPLYEREPASLLLGAWDSHRKGRWPKFARLYTAEVLGVDPVAGERAGGRMDPVNLVGVTDGSDAEGDWQYFSSGEKAKGTKLSEIGHGNIPPNRGHGGVSVTEVRRSGWMSFAGLRRLRFGDADDDAANLARAALAALAMVGDRLAFASASMWLRSGCDLTKLDETIGIERAGGAVDALTVSTADAVDAFHELQAEAASAGIVMATDVVPITPIPSLLKAINYAIAQASSDESS